MCGQSCNSGGVGGSIRCACICTSQQKQQQPQKPFFRKKQAVWVRMHLQGRRGRERVVLSLRATPFPLRMKTPNSQISLTFQGPRKSLMLAN